MPHYHVRFARETRGKRFGDEHRAVLSARTTDCNGEITAIVVAEMRQPLVDECLDVADHLLNDGQCLEKLDHGFVESRQWTQFAIVIRIRQRPYAPVR